MKLLKHSLRKIVTFLNNHEEDGGFWLPNIQRPFVWDEEQICRLFDSILRDYPISTLLIWKTRSPIRRRKFIDNYHHGLRLTDFYEPEDNKKKCLVLDGQQRLQSLFIGLKGSYEGKELYFDVLSGHTTKPDDIKYKFFFFESKSAQFPWIKFKDLVFSNKNSLALAQQVIKNAGRELNEEEQTKISEHIALIFKTFHSDEGVAYQELDSIENDSLYTEDDVVEIFIRANSGGTKLNKSDLLFALLNATWENADQQLETLLSELNRHGFTFTRDFILKTCLTLLGQGARYEVTKFRKPGVREEIEEKWDEIASAIKDVLDFVRGKTFIRCDKSMPSYLALIPLVHARYRFPVAWKTAQDIDNFLLRSLLTGAFSGTPDHLIDECVNRINKTQGFDASQMFDVIRSQGRNLELTEERLWDMGYGSTPVHLLFNVWYRQFNYTPAFEANLPQIDHIFPQSLLKTVKIVNPDSGKINLMKYRGEHRDQLANCMLLTQEENGSGGKGSTPPEQWFADKSEQYLDMHLIPRDKELWKLEHFEDFIEARKTLIRQKFAYLLVQPRVNPPQPYVLQSA